MGTICRYQHYKGIHILAYDVDKPNKKYLSLVANPAKPKSDMSLEGPAFVNFGWNKDYRITSS